MTPEDFEQMMQAAINGARQIVTVERQQLIPTVMLAGKDGSTQIVAIEGELRDAGGGWLRGIADGMGGVEAAVAVTEHVAATMSGVGDIAVVHGIWPGGGERKIACFDVTDDRWEPCQARVPGDQVRWLDAALGLREN